MKKKFIAMFIVVIMALTMTVTLVACSKKEKDIPSTDMVEVDSYDFVDYLVDSVIKSFTTEDGQYFSMDTKLVYEWKNGDQIEKYYLYLAFTLDLDPDRDTRDNQIMIELKKYVEGSSAQLVLGLHYVEQLENYDYSPLFLTVGEYKFQYKASSLKNILNGATAKYDDEEMDSLEQIKSLIGLVLDVAFNDFKLNGDKDKASMTFDVLGVVELFKSVVENNNKYGELDEWFAQLGIALTEEQLLAIDVNLDLVVNFEFDDGHLEDVFATMTIKQDHNIKIDTVDGKEIVNIKIAEGVVNISVDSLRLFGEKGFVYLPDDIENYKVIGLANLDISATVNFFRQDGSINNGAGSTQAIDVWLRADINPFVLLDGLNASNIKDLGVLHIRAANEKGTLFEIVFDPKNTGTNSIYFTFASMQTSLVKQELTFELEATIKILQELLAPTPAPTAIATQDGEGDGILAQIFKYLQLSLAEREDGGKNLMLTIDITPIREAVDSLLPDGVDILGTKLYLSNILLGDGNVTATLEFTSFKYGQLDTGYDATAWMNKGSSSFLKSIVAVNGKSHKTDYKLGEQLQYSQGSGLSLKVEMLNGKQSGILQPLNAKVIKVEGFDPTKLGEQQVTLYLRDNSLFASIIAGAVATDFELPLGVFTYTYTVNVTE